MYRKLISNAFIPARHNVLLTGDAAGLELPITGEGIGSALISGLAAANSILDSLRKGIGASQLYLKEIAPLISKIKDLYSLVGRFRDKSDSLFKPFIQVPRMRSTDRSVSNPAIDIVNDQDKITIFMELPGVERNDINVSLENGVLTISGERKRDIQGEKVSYLRKELYEGPFSRSFSIPEGIQADKISAVFKNGILRVLLGKREKVKPREINVNIG